MFIKNDSRDETYCDQRRIDPKKEGTDQCDGSHFDHFLNKVPNSRHARGICGDCFGF